MHQKNKKKEKKKRKRRNCARNCARTERHIAVAAEVLEAVLAQLERHERHVRGVHGLKRDAGAGAVKVGLLHEVLHGLDKLLEDIAFNETRFEHDSDEGNGERACALF